MVSIFSRIGRRSSYSGLNDGAPALSRPRSAALTALFPHVAAHDVDPLGRTDRADGFDLVVAVGDEPIQRDDRGHAEFLHVANMPAQVFRTALHGSGIGSAELLLFLSAVHLER